MSNHLQQFHVSTVTVAMVCDHLDIPGWWCSHSLKTFCRRVDRHLHSVFLHVPVPKYR
jgi:hypothetical protein